MRRINLEAICDAEQRSDAVRLGGAAKDAQIRRWLERQLAHEELRALALDELPASNAAERAARLRRIAAQGGRERCPLAELWAWEAEDEATRRSCSQACELRQRATTIQERSDCELGCQALDEERARP